MFETLSKNFIVKKLSSIQITVVCLFLLFVLVFWGTVAQVQQGLYVAQERFFNSFFFTAAGFLPFPGAQLVLWVLFVNLACVTITRFSRYRGWKNLGILVIHSGLLLYFVAAFVTFHLAQESNVHLLEGEGTNLSSSYHEWEVSIWQSPEDKRKIWALDAQAFKPGFSVALADLPFHLTVETFFHNSTAYKRGSFQKSGPLNGSGIGKLEPKDVTKEREKNIAGGVFRVTSSGKEFELLLYGMDSKPTVIDIDGQKYFFQLRHKKFPLPFVIKLVDFKAEFYPGTETARSFQSKVEILNANSKRDVLISMNKPLRHKDYTFYQASYVIDEFGREYSTLAVVKNAGRLLPYIACFVMFAGLVYHFLFKAFSR